MTEKMLTRESSSAGGGVRRGVAREEAGDGLVDGRAANEDVHVGVVGDGRRENGASSSWCSNAIGTGRPRSRRERVVVGSVDATRDGSLELDRL